MSSPPLWPDDTPYGQVGRLRERFGGTPAGTPRHGSLAGELPEIADVRYFTAHMCG